jgi:uncharacterized protein (TIGR03435 family)
MSEKIYGWLLKLYPARGERELATATSHRAELNAVQDGLKKLGLQLEPRKGPVSTVIIDHLEKTPTAN